MNTRKDRLFEAYEHLRKYHCIHTKKDLAESINHTLPAMYSAFSGNESYLTDSLFKKICYAFPDTFNLQYLLTGEGELLADSEYSYNDKVSQQYPTTLSERNPLPQWADNLIDILSQQIKENEALHRELRQSITEVNAIRTDLQKLIKKITQNP